LLVETGVPNSLLSQNPPLFEAISEEPPRVQRLHQLSKTGLAASPQLILLHTNLTGIGHLQEFVQLQSLFPFSSTIIAGEEHDEEFCLLALEAGADDVILVSQLTAAYLRRVVLLAIRRQQAERELYQSRQHRPQRRSRS